MDWEISWITRNTHLYTSPEHAEAVIRNIEKRYTILALKYRIKELELHAENK